MKLKIAALLGLSCLVICSALPADEPDSENAAAPPPKHSARPNILNKRNPLTRGGSAKGPTTTTTTTTTPPPDAEAEDEEPVEDGSPDEQLPAETTTTTEEPRRLKGGIVRPFRSKQDLLETLKKRREQAALNKAKNKAAHPEGQESAPVTEEQEKPQKRPSSSTRGRYNKKETATSAEPEEPSPPSFSRTNGARRFRN